MEEAVEWLRSVEAMLRDAEPPSCEAAVVRGQLKQQRPLSDDVAAQRVRVRDLLAQAKKVRFKTTEKKKFNEDSWKS